MKLNKTTLAIVLAGIVMGALAAKAHAKVARLDGTYVCDAQVWPVDKLPFDGPAETDQVRRYTVRVNSAIIEFTPVAGGRTVDLWFRDMDKLGWYGKTDTEMAYSARDEGGVYFGYRNTTTGDSVGFFNCVGKRKF